MEYIILLIIITISFILGGITTNLITPMIIKRLGLNQPIQPTPSTIPEILGYLNTLIDSEFSSVVELPNTVRGIQLISDFEKVQTEITKNVLNGLSTAFFIKVNMAGLKRDYIITYVTRRATMKIMGYISVNNFSLKK